jgi:hypothetical protein
MTDVVAKRFEQHIAVGMAIIRLSADALESQRRRRT